MPVLTPEQADKILKDMKVSTPANCDLCQTAFSDAVPAHRTSLGPFPSWMCSECLERHETTMARHLTGKAAAWE